VRTPELRNQGVRPRVWFGERWITSILDLFEENARYFPALMPVAEDTDPSADLAAGHVPELDELRLHNGTIWRWNRPVYDIANGEPHVRVENRVLPAGPTAVDMVANALFFYGLVRSLTDAERPLWTSMSFEAVEENFTTAARHGLEARCTGRARAGSGPTSWCCASCCPAPPTAWPGGASPARWSTATLSVIERRCALRRTGASWQLDTVAALQNRGADRPEAPARHAGPLPAVLRGQRPPSTPGPSPPDPPRSTRTRTAPASAWTTAAHREASRSRPGRVPHPSGPAPAGAALVAPPPAMATPAATCRR
jgi:hypothetical protein